MQLNIKFLGKNYIYYKTIDSTQLEIWRRVEKNDIKNGTVIRADIQTKGKGTHGRIWHTDEENNIAFSFFIEANCNIKKLQGMTLEIAQTILEVFKTMYNIELSIKLPNDIIYNGKKIGGILTETKLIGEEVKYIVIGIGINTSKTKFEEDLKNIATSIINEFNVKVDVQEFIIEFCKLFEIKLIKRLDIMHKYASIVDIDYKNKKGE